MRGSDRLGRFPPYLIETVAMISRGLTVREAAARLKIGETALHPALRDAPELLLAAVNSPFQ